MLPWLNDEGLYLKPSHSYYTQLQTGMAITGCKWADFVVYTKHDGESSLSLQRILFDTCFWSGCVKAVKDFYCKYVMLELMTKRLKREVSLLPVDRK